MNTKKKILSRRHVCNLFVLMTYHADDLLFKISMGKLVCYVGAVD